jgi:TonB family protein
MERRFFSMHLRGKFLVVSCLGVVFAGTHRAKGQEAASANLPDQFQTGEMASIFKAKKKTEPSSQNVATMRKRNAAPAPEQTPAPEEPPPPGLSSEEKKVEPSAGSASSPPSQPRATVSELQSPILDSAAAIAPVKKKPHPKKRLRPAIQPEPVSVPAPVPISLSVAQSMAIKAPLPMYPYEAKRRDVTGSGVCVLTVDPGTGNVTDAIMEQSTGDRVLDKVTTETFKSWRFKPGTLSQIRLPVSYE